jgi:hypothetical protein
MPGSFILTSPTPELLASWERQLPAGAVEVINDVAFPSEIGRPGAKVWIKDLSDSRGSIRAHPDTVTIAVGEPHSIPFEAAKSDPLVSYCLSYSESRASLATIASMANELAEKRAALALYQARQRRPEVVAAPEAVQHRSVLELDFVELAIERLESQSEIVDAFRRAFRSRLRASRATVFVREGKVFSAGANEDCPVNDPFVYWLQSHGAIVDAEAIDGIENPADAVRIHRRIGSWQAKVVVPVDIQGTLGGWVTLGSRIDGRAFTSSDKEQAVMLAGLLGRFIVQHRALSGAIQAKRQTEKLNENGPQFRVVEFTSDDVRSLPAEAREVVGLVRRDRKRVDREFGRMKISAGPIAREEACWILWDDQGATAASLAARLEAERYRIRHDLGIIISHELANAMFSVTTFYQKLRANLADFPPSVAGIVPQVESDLKRLKEMPHLLAGLHEMAKERTTEIDMNELAESVARACGGSTSLPGVAPSIWGHQEQLRNAIIWLAQEIERPATSEILDRKPARIKLSLQWRGKEGPEGVCLVTLAYPGLRLDQIKAGEAADVGEYPTVPIFLAREIIRYHYGTIHVGQGIDGPEVCIALKSRINTDGK